MFSMISIIMRSKIDTEKPITMEREKIYFFNTNIIQEWLSTKKKDEKLIFLKEYILKSLLNLPNALIDFGPLVKLLESENQDDGYLRYVKLRIRDVHSKNCNINVNIGLMNEISMVGLVNLHLLFEQCMR